MDNLDELKGAEVKELETDSYDELHAVTVTKIDGERVVICSEEAMSVVEEEKYDHY